MLPENLLESVVHLCRVWDTSIVVAVEEMPDEGLDQPLRLDKLANEVPPLRQILFDNCTQYTH